jgi:hypothetical protein
MRSAMPLALVLALAACVPTQAPSRVVNYVPVPVPQPAPTAPTAPQTSTPAEAPAVWYFYNASSGQCERISRIDLTRILTAGEVAGCRDLIPNVPNAFVIVCPANATTPPSVWVFGVTQSDCEQAQAAAEVAGVATGEPIERTQPRVPPSRVTF